MRPVRTKVVTAYLQPYRFIWNRIAWMASPLETDRLRVNHPIVRSAGR